MARVWYEEAVPLPLIETGRLTSDRVSLSLVSTASAAVESDLSVSCHRRAFQRECASMLPPLSSRLRLCVARCARDACTRSGPAYTNAQVRLKPWGVIPKFGRVTIELPFGFILRAGSTVATEQMNFGDFNAIYVSSQV